MLLDHVAAVEVAHLPEHTDLSDTKNPEPKKKGMIQVTHRKECLAACRMSVSVSTSM